MLSIESVEKKFADFYQSNRQSIIAQLRAQGVPAPEAIVNNVIANTARAVAPNTLERITENLRRAYADSPEYLSLLLAPENTPNDQPRSDFIAGAIARRAQAKLWLDYQVAAAIERMGADEIVIGPHQPQA